MVRCFQPVEVFRKKSVTGGFISTEQGNVLRILVWGLNQDTAAWSCCIWSSHTSLQYPPCCSVGEPSLFIVYGKGFDLTDRAASGIKMRPLIENGSRNSPSVTHRYITRFVALIGRSSLWLHRDAFWSLASRCGLLEVWSDLRCLETNASKHGASGAESSE